MISVEEFLVRDTATLGDLLKILNNRVSGTYGSGFAVVIDDAGKIVGTCSDADLRRYFLSHTSMPASAADVAQLNFVAVDGELGEKEQLVAISKIFEERGWLTEVPSRIIPVVANQVPIGLLEISPDNPEMSLLRDRAIVLGLGFVGLTLACAIADSGVETHGVEVDEHKRSQLKSGHDYTGEPGIRDLLSRHLSKSLFVHSSVGEIAQSPMGRRNVFLVCVGTPLTSETGVNRAFLDSAIEEIATVITRGSLIVLRSTVPIGTTRELARTIERKLGWQVGSDFYVASAPERTVEGDALRELRKLPQLIAGVTPSCSNKAIDFFRPISESIVNMENPEAAELAKLASNAFRDYVFGFANHIASISRRHNIDVNQMIDQMNSGYTRNSVPQPSPGVGGPCLTKDSWMLELTAEERQDSPILSARRRNLSYVREIGDFLEKVFVSGGVSNLLCLGLAFKGIPATPDLRGSPGLEIAQALANKGFQIRGVDAVAKVESSGILRPEPSFHPEAFLLLNNHHQNVEMLEEYLSKSSISDVYIFDPWRLVSFQLLRRFSSSDRRFKGFSLSHSWEA